MVTFHPVTLENATACKQFDNLLTSLDGVREYRILFTKANADTDGRIINEKIDSYVKNNKGRAVAYTSLGMKRYLSALQYSEMVIGNSSSGILEAPSFKIPTVNIGSRQLGRIRAKSVIDCTNSVEAISDAISKAKALKTKRELENIRNPYEKSNTSENILFEIRRYLLNGKLAVKNFYDI